MLSDTNVFPYRVHAHDNGHYVRSPRLATTVWHRLRDGTVWYAADFTVLSPTSIQLLVYDMEDSFYGGIGRVILEKTIDKLTDAEQEMLDEVVLEIYDERAHEIYLQRKAAEDRKKIDAIRLEIFGI